MKSSAFRRPILLSNATTTRRYIIHTKSVEFYSSAEGCKDRSRIISNIYSVTSATELGLGIDIVKRKSNPARSQLLDNSCIM